MVDLKSFNIPGFHNNNSMESELNSVYYDKDSDIGDSWIEIAEDSYEPDNIIILFVVDGVTTKITAVKSSELDTLENWLCEKVKDIFKD